MSKILILGHSRGGKDQFAEYLGVSYQSSSRAALEIFLFDELNAWLNAHFLKPYESHEEAYNDRHNWRDLWHKLIAWYNKDDPTRLARGILENNDCYVGMRSNREYQACMEAGLFGHVFWVDGTERTGITEDRSSFDIDFDRTFMARVNNNGELNQLKFQARQANQIIELLKEMV